jgi:hypothetical protein
VAERRSICDILDPAEPDARVVADRVLKAL